MSKKKRKKIYATVSVSNDMDCIPPVSFDATEEVEMDESVTAAADADVAGAVESVAANDVAPNNTVNKSVQKKSTPSKLFYGCAFLFAAVVMVALDQWLKVWSSANLAGNAPRTLINGVLGLTYFHNTGAAFGFLGGADWGRWVLTVLVLGLLAVVGWYYFKLPNERRMWLVRVPLLLIFGGGVGNLIDRVRLGYVVDMIEFLFMRFAIFNLADVFVTVGAFAAVAAMIYLGKDAPWPFDDKKAAASDKADD